MKKRLLLVLAIAGLQLLLTPCSMGQCVIRGMVKDDFEKPVSFADILLLYPSDSSLVKGTITDDNGYFHLDKVKKGSYLIEVSHANSAMAYTGLINISAETRDFNAGVIHLKPLLLELKKVTVETPRPLFEQKADRMVINVQNSIIGVTGSVLDVLEKSPGVIVDRQNNSIAINGKSGVEVMLDGKLSYLPFDALVELLDGMSAADIEKIEIITTPPSKYDAAGNAGIINIVFIQNPFEDVSGSCFVAAGYGKRPLVSAGANINYHHNRLSWYGNYSYNLDQFVQTTTGLNQFTSNGKVITENSYTNGQPVRNVNNLQAGLDYQIDSSNTLSALVRGYKYNWRNLSNNGAAVQVNSSIDTIIRTKLDEKNDWNNLMTNLSFSHSFKSGNLLDLEANYIYYNDNHPDRYDNSYYDGSNSFLYDEMVRTYKITPINFYVFSGDYTAGLGKTISLDAGAKISLTRFNNDIGLDRLKQNNWVTDSSLSANYKMIENIAAAYASVSVRAGATTTIKAGLRYEYTRSLLDTKNAADVVNRKYGQLFPTFYFAKKLDKDNNIDFSYSRRITRPTFNDLAPFTIFLDPKTFYYGNPGLLPAIANAVKTSYTYKDFIFSLNYTYENNTVEHFQTQSVDTVNNLVYVSARNFKYEQFLTASFSAPVSLTGWWNMQNNLNLNWHQVNTTYENKDVRLGIYFFNARTTQSFSLHKNISLELSGLYTSASYFGTAKLDPVYRIDAGFQIKFANKKDNLRFTANDIFNSGSKYRFADQLPVQGTVLKGSGNSGRVAFKLTFTHNFGDRILKSIHPRTTGAEDEMQRIRN
ncbi:MAG TPA: TonB-dependent receptor [Chitinophagaceae bacterium]|nr:TonB-dependent receptor [Chitinophagaceae bacterium]